MVRCLAETLADGDRSAAVAVLYPMTPDAPADPGRAARRELARAVSADLEGIFRPAAPAAPDSPRQGRVRSFAAAGAGARERRPARIGALVATALAGLALGAVVANPPRIGGPKPQPEPTRVAAIAVPPVNPPPALVTQPPPTVAPAPRPAPAAVQKASVKPKPKPARAAPARQTARSSDGYRCADLRGDAEARCAYPAVLAADRRLRDAYRQAVRAGVPRSTLVSYRSRWASLRHRADDQPERVIRGYREMAQDLTRLARDVRT